MLEPVARNTAPAIAVAALLVARENPDGILVVMPSDHVIKDEAAFVDAVRRAADVAATGQLVLFGITPTEPHTGYGYIRRGAPLAGFAGGLCGRRLHREARPRRPPSSYLAAGSYFWNSGIFVLARATFLDELQRLEPAILEAAARGARPRRRRISASCASTTAAFASAPSISVDYAVMEKHRHGGDAADRRRLERRRLVVVAVGDRAARRGRQRRRRRCRCSRTPRNCYVHTERSLVATIGVKDLVIVDTPDALLVADKPRAQDVSAHRRAPEGGRTARSTSSTCATTGRGATSRR